MASGLRQVKTGKDIFQQLHANVLTLEPSKCIRDLVERLLMTNTMWDSGKRGNGPSGELCENKLVSEGAKEQESDGP